MKNVFWLMVVLVFAAILTGCNQEQTEIIEKRTHYDSLNLDTPEAAVLTFVDAFQRNDFESVYLIFSPWSQFEIANHIHTLNYRRLIKYDHASEVNNILAETPMFQPIETWEHRSTSYLFDRIMLAAKQHSAFLVNLHGKVSITSNTNAPLDVTDDTVAATVEGINGEVLFYMEKSPEGRWRVRQIVTVGGDDELVPWSVPSK